MILSKKPYVYSNGNFPYKINSKQGNMNPLLRKSIFRNVRINLSGDTLGPEELIVWPKQITKKYAKYLKSIFVYIELMSSGQFEVWHLRTTSASMLANPAEEKKRHWGKYNGDYDKGGDHNDHCE